MTFVVTSRAGRSAPAPAAMPAATVAMLLGLAKTCDKLGIAMWDYLGSRLKVAGHRLIQPLDHYVRGRFCPA